MTRDPALTDRQRQQLEDLADIGLEVARAIQRQAQAADADTDVNAIAMAYARVSRAVRLTILMQSQAAEAPRQPDAAYVHKARVERIVERVARAEHRDDEDELDRLVAEAGERLDDEDLYGDVLDKPLGELVALICKDLGLQPDWDALGQEAWAKEETSWPRNLPRSWQRSAGGGPLAEERAVEGESGFHHLYPSLVRDSS